MTEPQTPSSPAGAASPIDVDTTAPSSLPRLRASDVFGTILAGLPTVLFTTIAAATVAMQFTGSFVQRDDGAVTGLLVVIPGVGLAVFLRRWVITLRELARGIGDDVRWTFLLVPFFVVTGVACGTAFAVAVTHSDEPGGVIVRVQCRDLIAAKHGARGAVGFDEHFAAMAVEASSCEAVGQACIATLLAEGRETPEALRQCVAAGFQKASDP